jgi:hypothetical protein
VEVCTHRTRLALRVATPLLLLFLLLLGVRLIFSLVLFVLTFGSGVATFKLTCNVIVLTWTAFGTGRGAAERRAAAGGTALGGVAAIHLPTRLLALPH